MGLEIKRNSKGEYSLKSSISNESYHPDKKWISIDEAKVLLIHKAFYRFVEEAINIDMTFPNGYTVNDKRERNEELPDFNEWHLSILREDDYGKNLFKKFNEVLKKHDMDLDTSVE